MAGLIRLSHALNNLEESAVILARIVDGNPVTDWDSLAGEELIQAAWKLRPLTDSERHRIADAIHFGDETTLREIGREATQRK